MTKKNSFNVKKMNGRWNTNMKQYTHLMTTEAPPGLLTMFYSKSGLISLPKSKEHVTPVTIKAKE